MNAHPPKTILITGGTGKLGRILVKALAEQGHHVIFTSRDPEKIRTFVNQDTGLANVDGIVLDLERDDVGQAAETALNELGTHPQILINNARNLDYLKLSDSHGPNRQQWLGEYRLDVVAPFELTMHLADQAEGRLEKVVNISSMYGVVPFNPRLYESPAMQAPINYSVAKAAQIHLTKELAIRLAPRRIQVNCVSYGGVQGRVDEDFQRRYAEHCPMGRMLQEEEVAGAVQFLISEQSAGMTGHNLVVDGGWSIW